MIVSTGMSDLLEESTRPWRAHPAPQRSARPAPVHVGLPQRLRGHPLAGDAHVPERYGVRRRIFGPRARDVRQRGGRHARRIRDRAPLHARSHAAGPTTRRRSSHRAEARWCATSATSRWRSARPRSASSPSEGPVRLRLAKSVVARRATPRGDGDHRGHADRQGARRRHPGQPPGACWWASSPSGRSRPTRYCRARRSSGAFMREDLTPSPAARRDYRLRRHHLRRGEGGDRFSTLLPLSAPTWE